MLYLDRLKTSLSTGITAVILHLSLVIGVAVYAVFGALIMQALESNGEAVAPASVEESDLTKRSSNDISTATEANPVLIFSGTELAKLHPSVHDCVKRAIESMIDVTKCDDESLEKIALADLDECYREAMFETIDSDEVVNQLSNVTSEEDLEEESEESMEEKWTFTNAVIFTYTVITTIGYGHVAPITFEGRLFCILYGLIGVPFTLLTIADLGLFLSKVLGHVAHFILRPIGMIKTLIRKRRTKKKLAKSVSAHINNEKIGNGTTGENSIERGSGGKLTEEEEEEEDEGPGGRDSVQSAALGLAFLVYLLSGAYALSLYEPEMDFFKAIYFNFVTLTTVGLGDFVPKRETYLSVTMLYITVGLALTTMSVEIAADYLKQLHYFGRKIENVANADIWFGGKKMKMKSLLKHLGDQLNIPVEELENFNLDTFVDSAIKVEAGEIKSLRKPEAEKVVMRNKRNRPISYRDLRKSGESETLRYVDERISVITTGSEPPLAEETARTVTSLILPRLEEVSSVGEEALELKESPVAQNTVTTNKKGFSLVKWF